jgi:glyoxylase-like metal-dependent hydrolase (beta-lactamase superfamily II)
MGALTPEDTVFHLDTGRGALLFADGLIRRRNGALAFVPDHLMGDDPEGVRRGLRESLRRLLDEDFDALLFAHGEPLASGGRAALREFVG